jgi:hypothetical protein
MARFSIFRCGRRRFCREIFSLLIAVLGFSISKATETPATDSATAPSNPNAATQPSDLNLDGMEPSDYVDQSASRMKEAGIFVWEYAKSHNDNLPADLGILLLQDMSRQCAECFLTPGEERRTPVPDKPDADWVNHHTSYVYIAAGINRAKIVPKGNTAAGVWGTTVMFHTRFDQPFFDPKLGDVIILTYLDGHSERQPLKNARKIIEASEKVLELGRDSTAK